MSDFVFPFSWRELPRAVEWLNEQKANGPAVTLDDFLAWWGQGIIELCYFWGDMGLVVPDRGDFMSFVDGYLYSACTDPTDIPMMMIKPYGTEEDYRPVKLPHGTPDAPYELAYDLTASGLVIPHAEMLKVWRLFNPLPDDIHTSCGTFAISAKPEHGNRESNARWRERVLLAAGYVKTFYPEECKNRFGRETVTAWADALRNHWHLFGDDHDIPGDRFAKDIIGDIFRLPAERKRAGKNAP
ncbi:hypothetical protein OIH90_003537 [Salmonella enterica]|nr:hypothetical protein [Salmonella enterica]EDX1147039.1 hypothetical protein [Salmonella enterica]EGO7291806.1 hypothetical protein [Salmonella enterica]EGZ6464036.1 hypothetical protein [Salmonella enterica]EJZ6099878.1 hypothetical protein [Salmonella enterica]